MLPTQAGPVWMPMPIASEAGGWLPAAASARRPSSIS